MWDRERAGDIRRRGGWPQNCAHRGRLSGFANDSLTLSGVNRILRNNAG